MFFDGSARATGRFVTDSEKFDFFVVNSLLVNWRVLKSPVDFLELVQFHYLVGDVYARHVLRRSDYEFHVLLPC